jgi:hypothetical protein
LLCIQLFNVTFYKNSFTIWLSEIRLGDSDRPVWTVANKGIYVSSDTWNHLRKKKVEVDWWPLIWFPHAILKQAFLMWLAVKNRLTTGDRLLAWGYNGDTQCVFFRHGIESRNHLFFQCSFSSRVWQNCMHRCNIDVPVFDWPSVIATGCVQWKTKRLRGVLCRLALSSVVYHLWKARNEIRHQGRPKTEEQLLRSIYWEIRSCISGKGRFSKTKENFVLCLNWNIPFDVLVYAVLCFWLWALFALVVCLGSVENFSL